MNEGLYLKAKRGCLKPHMKQSDQFRCRAHPALFCLGTLLLILVCSACRERCFPSCGRGFLRDQDPRTRSQIRKRTRPRTTSSASFSQTASQRLVRIPPDNLIPLFTFYQRLLSICCNECNTHPPSLVSSLSHQPSVHLAPPKQEMLVEPKRSCSRRAGSSSITESSCSTVTFLGCSVSLFGCNLPPLNILLTCPAPLAVFIDTSRC